MGVVLVDLPAYRGWCSALLSPLRYSSKMKLLLVFVLITVSLAWEDKKMMKYWEKMKAAESCWGEENFKQYMVSFKKAVAKCHGEDAPELDLPPFRSSYRFVNTLMNSANDMEDNQSNMMMMMMMMRMMMNNRQSTHSTIMTSTAPTPTPWPDSWKCSATLDPRDRQATLTWTWETDWWRSSRISSI